MNVIVKNEKIQNHLFSNSQFYNNLYSKPDQLHSLSKLLYLILYVKLELKSKSPIKIDIYNNKKLNLTQNSKFMNLENETSNKPRRTIQNVANAVSSHYNQGDNITECSDNESSTNKSKILSNIKIFLS